MKLIDHFITLIASILLIVIMILIYLRFPSTIDHLTKLSWPKAKVEVSDENPVIVSAQYLDGSLAEGQGVAVVQKHCLGCHSAQLITQNRMSRERWEYTIRWMQRTQGLWDLGSDEPVVLDYLAEYYAPQKVGRRANLQLDEEDWYPLSE